MGWSIQSPEVSVEFAAPSRATFIKNGPDMDWQIFEDWLSRSPLVLVAALLFGAMCAAAAIGLLFRRSHRETGVGGSDGGDDGYVVSAVLGLLALLLGFTFSLAADRFDTRRILVLEEANAIGTTYLRAQLLTEPHRARM